MHSYHLISVAFFLLLATSVSVAQTKTRWVLLPENVADKAKALFKNNLSVSSNRTMRLDGVIPFRQDLMWK